MALRIDPVNKNDALTPEDFITAPELTDFFAPGDVVPLIRNERVYDLVCDHPGCTAIGGEVRFPEDHGRASDAALAAEISSQYVHFCDTHSL